jgi:outer membrane protein assembly factor BamA
LNYVNTVRGIGPNDISFLSWEGSWLTSSRDYELFTRDRFSGWQGGVEYRGQRKGVGSPINVDRYEVNMKNLWNVGGLVPPLVVLGARVQGVAVNSTKTNLDPSKEHELLPADYRVFYGGDENLRGFSRQSLNNNGLGYLTALYFGLEMRLIEELPYHLEPFLLFDGAALGDRRVTLDHPLFLSEGLGLRWASPFGTLRGSLAKGRILHEDQTTEGYRQEWVAFVSFGQEF